MLVSCKFKNPGERLNMNMNVESNNSVSKTVLSVAAFDVFQSCNLLSRKREVDIN